MNHVINDQDTLHVAAMQNMYGISPPMPMMMDPMMASLSQQQISQIQQHIGSQPHPHLFRNMESLSHVPNVFVTDLPIEMTADQIYQVFARHGECSIRLIPHSGYSSALINYDSATSASKAVSTIHLGRIYGRTVRCFLTSQFPELRTAPRITLQDLDPQIEPNGLLQVAELFGEVIDLKIEENQYNRSTGRAVIQYRHSEDAVEALNKLLWMMIGPYILKVKVYTDADDFAGMNFSF